MAWVGRLLLLLALLKSWLTLCFKFSQSMHHATSDATWLGLWYMLECAADTRDRQLMIAVFLVGFAAGVCTRSFPVVFLILPCCYLTA
jgi:hypothetical protein